MMNENGLIQKLDGLGYTQQELAKKLGVAQSMVSGVLRGEIKPGKKFLRGVIREFPQLIPEAIVYLRGEE